MFSHCIVCREERPTSSKPYIRSTHGDWWGRWVCNQLAKGVDKKMNSGTCPRCAEVWAKRYAVLGGFLKKLGVIPKYER
jgi:hypothetical protein